MRRLILSFVVAGLLAVIGAAPAAANEHVALPDRACNQGTERAHDVAGGPAHPHIPHEMGGVCMTMPARHPGP